MYVVARRPGIRKKFGAALLEARRQLVAQPVERLAQRAPATAGSSRVPAACCSRSRRSSARRRARSSRRCSRGSPPRVSADASPGTRRSW